MICQRGGLVIQRHNEIRDLQAELLDMVCYDVQVEPALQPITGEELASGTNHEAPVACLDVHCRGFWERPPIWCLKKENIRQILLLNSP